MLGRAERHDLPVSLLLTDIDHFKKINDSYGHPTGDEVLRRVAAILKASARKIDIVARYGGEEFAHRARGDRPRRARASWPSASAQEIEQQSFQSSKGTFNATLSLGVAELSRRRAREGRPHRARRPGALRRQTRRPQPHRLFTDLDAPSSSWPSSERRATRKRHRRGERRWRCANVRFEVCDSVANDRDVLVLVTEAAGFGRERRARANEPSRLPGVLFVRTPAGDRW